MFKQEVPGFRHNRKMATSVMGLWYWKLAKLGIVGGAVYVTVANGVWSKENDQVKNLVSQLRVAEAVNLQQDENAKPWGETWNSGVQKVFKTIGDSPDIAKDYSSKAMKATKDLVQQKS